MKKKVTLYHVWVGKRDEFTLDFDEAEQLFAQLAREYEGDFRDVHLHAEEYATEADFESDNLLSDECTRSVR